MRRLVREAMATGEVARVLTLAPPVLAPAGDLAEMYIGAAERAAGLPVEMARVAAEEGAAFFDAGSVMEVDPMDGVHWSGEAHRALGEALVGVVSDLAP